MIDMIIIEDSMKRTKDIVRLNVLTYVSQTCQENGSLTYVDRIVERT